MIYYGTLERYSVFGHFPGESQRGHRAAVDAYHFRGSCPSSLGSLGAIFNKTGIGRER